MRKHIVSGASSGVGLELVKVMNRDNEHVLGFGKRGMPPLDYPFGTRYRSIDYTKEYSFDFYKKPSGVLSNEDKIDSITFCSAVFKMDRLVHHSDTEIEKMIAINFTAMIRFVKYFRPMMKSSGKIILVSSVSGLRGQKHQTVYSATKHAMQGFADSLRQEVPQRVTTICPGGIDTPLWHDCNPYPGDNSLLLKPRQVADTILNVINSDENVVYKNITLYPENESH